MDKKLQVEVKKALEIAASVLDVAADCNFTDVQVKPPAEWNLNAYIEESSEGWCSTRELAGKLKELAKQL